jgi:hypothetical protein
VALREKKRKLVFAFCLAAAAAAMYVAILVKTAYF